MAFSTNQARQLYVAVARKTSAEPSVVGDIKACLDPKGNLYFKYYGKGGLLRSDLITNISYAKMTVAADLETKLKTATVTVTDVDTEEAQDYVLRVVVNQAFGMSDEEVYTREVSARSNSSSTAATVAAELGDLIKKTLKRDHAQLFDITVEGAAITFDELPQEWHRGTMEQVGVNFSIELLPIDPGYTPTTSEGVTTYDWGTVEVEDQDTGIPDGKKIADLEYFCMGERGDQYRLVGWPNTIFSIEDCMVDPDGAYDVLDIHYAYQGSCEDIQKSEKDITIVSKTSNLIKQLATEVQTKTGFTVKGIPA